MLENKEDACRIYRAKTTDGRTIRAIVVPNAQEVYLIACHCDFTEKERERLDFIANGITEAWNKSVFRALDFISCKIIKDCYELSCTLSKALRALVPLPENIIECNNTFECKYASEGCNGHVQSAGGDGPVFPPCAEGYELEAHEICPFES